MSRHDGKHFFCSRCNCNRPTRDGLAYQRCLCARDLFEGTRTDEADLAEKMSKGDFLLGYDESDRLVASVYVEIRLTRGYFGMLAVDSAHQGKGLGRSMVQAAEDYCRKQGCTAMDLTVLSLRRELPPIYRKLGYVETGTEKFYPLRPLKDGVKCHCIVMSKEL